MVHRTGSGEPQRAACLYERLISEWWGVRLTLLRKKGFLHLRFRYFEKTESDFWLSNFLSYIFLISSHLCKNTAFSCGIFACIFLSMQLVFRWQKRCAGKPHIYSDLRLLVSIDRRDHSNFLSAFPCHNRHPAIQKMIKWHAFNSSEIDKEKSLKPLDLHS